MKKGIVVLAVLQLFTLGATVRAAEQNNQSQNIINKFEPERAAEKKPDPEIPVYSSKAELLKDIKEGEGLFYFARGISIYANEWPRQTEAGTKVKNINIAFAKSVKLIVENEYNTPLTISFDQYPSWRVCGFAEVLALTSRSLLNYIEEVKLRKPEFLDLELPANQKIDEARKEFDQRSSHFKACVTEDGNNYEPIGALLGEMADALNVRVEMIKAKRREHLGYKLNEAFLISHVIETDGASASPGLLTSVEGLLEDLSKKATFNKWVVKGDSYTLNAIYEKTPLVINMVNLPEKGVTTVEGTLNKKKLRAKDIIKLTRIVRVN